MLPAASDDDLPEHMLVQLEQEQILARRHFRITRKVRADGAIAVF
jgi:hypothetical protein